MEHHLGARLVLPLAERSTGWCSCPRGAGHRSSRAGTGVAAIRVTDVSRSGHGDVDAVGAEALRLGRTHRPAATSGEAVGDGPTGTTTLPAKTTTPDSPTRRAVIARGSSGRRAAPSHGSPAARQTNSSKARSNGGRPWQQHPL